MWSLSYHPEAKQASAFNVPAGLGRRRKEEGGGRRRREEEGGGRRLEETGGKRKEIPMVREKRHKKRGWIWRYGWDREHSYATHTSLLSLLFSFLSSLSSFLSLPCRTIFPHRDPLVAHVTPVPLVPPVKANKVVAAHLDPFGFRIIHLGLYLRDIPLMVLF